METETKKTPRGAAASILAAAALWGIIGVWNRRLMAGGLSPFLTAFLSGRKLTQKEGEELKELIDRTMGEG